MRRGKAETIGLILGPLLRHIHGYHPLSWLDHLLKNKHTLHFSGSSLVRLRLVFGCAELEV